MSGSMSAACRLIIAGRAAAPSILVRARAAVVVVEKRMLKVGG